MVYTQNSIKYEGKWKPTIHSRYTSVCITNEHNNTSQTCLFYSQKLAHPLKVITNKGRRQVRSVKGTFVHNNKACLLQHFHSTHKGRYSVSALTIGILGAETIMLQIPFPVVFDPKTFISQSDTGKFKKYLEHSPLESFLGPPPVLITLYLR